MSEPVSASKPDPSPFEKLRAFTAQILAVPKSEIDRREDVWKKARQRKHAKKR